MTVGSIIGGGFRVIREHPGAVAIWALLYLVLTAGAALIIRPTLGDGSLAVSEMGSMVGAVILVQLLTMALLVALLAASQRAVLDPKRRSFAYLRLGLGELRLIGLTIVLAIAFYLGMVIAMLLMTLVTGLVVVAAGPGVAIPLAVVEGLMLMAAVIWLQVRLSLTFPLTLMRGKLVIGEAWRVTRSRFWTLFGAYLVISLLLMVLWIAAALLTSGGYLLELMRSGFDPGAIQAAGERQMAEYLGGITILTVIGWIVTSAAAAFSIALFGGAVATAAVELTEDVDVLAETFA